MYSVTYIYIYICVVHTYYLYVHYMHIHYAYISLISCMPNLCMYMCVFVCFLCVCVCTCMHIHAYVCTYISVDEYKMNILILDNSVVEEEDEEEEDIETKTQSSSLSETHSQSTEMKSEWNLESSGEDETCNISQEIGNDIEADVIRRRSIFSHNFEDSEESLGSNASSLSVEDHYLLTTSRRATVLAGIYYIPFIPIINYCISLYEITMFLYNELILTITILMQIITRTTNKTILFRFPH